MPCDITVGQEDPHHPRPQVVNMLQLGKLVFRAGKHQRVTAALPIVRQSTQVIAKKAERAPIHHKGTPVHLDKLRRRRRSDYGGCRHFNLNPNRVAKALASGVGRLPDADMATSLGRGDHRHCDRPLGARPQGG